MDVAKTALTKGSTQDEVRAYFQGVLELTQSSEQYPVNLNDVWRLAYSRKSDAVAALKKFCIKDFDYQVIKQNPQNPQGGRPETFYVLSPSCMEYLIARKVRPVFEVYRQVFHKAAQNALPMTYKDALKQLLAQEEAREQLEAENKEQAKQLQARQATIDQQEQKIRKDAPKVEYYDQVLAATGDLNVSEIARFLGMTAEQLNKKLKAAGIIYKTSPYSKTWLLRKPYCNWNLANPRTSVFRRSDGSEGASVITVYNQRGVRFIRALHACSYNVKQAVAMLRTENQEKEVEYEQA